MGTKASLAQLGVCSRGWRVLEGVLNNSSPGSAQSLLHMLLAQHSPFPCEARERVWHWSSQLQQLVPALKAFAMGWVPVLMWGVSKGTDNKKGAGRGVAGSHIWLLSVMILRGGQTSLAAGTHGAVSAAQRGTSCSLAEARRCGFLRKQGVWFGLQGCLSPATSHHPQLCVHCHCKP